VLRNVDTVLSLMDLHREPCAPGHVITWLTTVCSLCGSCTVQGAFTLLMWKNGKLHQRRPIGTCVQIMLPVLFIGILWLVRNLTAVNKKTMCER
jgi:hypothetical protein